MVFSEKNFRTVLSIFFAVVDSGFDDFQIVDESNPLYFQIVDESNPLDFQIVIYDGNDWKWATKWWKTLFTPVVTVQAPSADAFAIGLIDRLEQDHVKFTRKNLRAMTEVDEKIVFLEKGNDQAGLQHIFVRHLHDFNKVGIMQAQIPVIIMAALRFGRKIGYQQSDRPIYEILWNGQYQKIAITVSDNGFVVGANPKGVSSDRIRA